MSDDECPKCSGQNVPHCTCPEWCGHHQCLHASGLAECRCVVAGDQLLTSACFLHGDGSATPGWVAAVARTLSERPEQVLSPEDVDALRARLMSADVQENESLRSQLAVVRDANSFLTDNCKRLARERADLRDRLTGLADEWEIDRYGNDSRAFRARLACAEDLRNALVAPAGAVPRGTTMAHSAVPEPNDPATEQLLREIFTAPANGPYGTSTSEDRDV